MDINATFIGQALAFAILIWFSYKFVWPPMMGAIEERQQKIAEGLAAADRSQKDLAQAQEKVNEALKEARVKANEIIDQAHARANQIVDAAKNDAIAEANRQKALAEAEIDAATTLRAAPSAGRSTRSATVSTRSMCAVRCAGCSVPGPSCVAKKRASLTRASHCCGHCLGVPVLPDVAKVRFSEPRTRAFTTNSAHSPRVLKRSR